MSKVDTSAWGAEPPLFVRLLAAEAAATTRTAAALRIGMSRTAVSRILANKYDSPSTAHVERRVMEALGRIDCPALDKPLTVEECQAFYTRPAPTHNPMAMQHWRVCQQCPLNPNCGGNGNAAVH